MKKILLNLLVSFNIFACELSAPKFVAYDPSHKQALMEMVTQDPYKFFLGGSDVEQGIMTEENFLTENKKVMEGLFDNPAAVKRVLIVENKVAGFVEVSKIKEQSLESIIKMIVAQGIQGIKHVDEGATAAVAAALPHLKKTDAECIEYGSIGSLMVSKEFRNKGFGRKVLKDALQEIKSQWPTLAQARLNVNANNPIAIKLYESEGYTKSEIQPADLASMKAFEYRKLL
jgi:ribosomal protein S18 acetylase RimI-like enzyme